MERPRPGVQMICSSFSAGKRLYIYIYMYIFCLNVRSHLESKMNYNAVTAACFDGIDLKWLLEKNTKY